MTQRKLLEALHVYRSPLHRSRGLVVAGPVRVPCALGRAGVRRADAKREGDGATPAGRYRPLRAFYRPDRGRRPAAALPMRPLAPDDGWCDDVAHRSYNRAVKRPFAGGHERMWRDDGLYDVVVEIDHNARPRVRGRGSAIFIHMAKPGAGGRGLAPTEGCVALPPGRLRTLLERIGPRTRIVIH
ncbi:L,D-transpeptidase family protein [Chelatococcus reniformis]|uniref:L,D-TPase catalytic domain-containing protein n=1 Tax=Chelatococcus reniformis TaxID=1494448 RepID=A0A916X8R2_9HYPH|nr:L,D-transpeptidase family protein [Chelatococcus reniformis]GGC51519.1 hypothetical protein GCM10010994_08290 [Chelatococcus reniformis]